MEDLQPVVSEPAEVRSPVGREISGFLSPPYQLDKLYFPQEARGGPKSLQQRLPMTRTLQLQKGDLTM